MNAGPYLGDYPHIGADANGFYITTNAYPWLRNGFAGAQIYALSKAQLAAGAAHVNMQHIDTSGMVNAPSDAGQRSRASRSGRRSRRAPSFNTANNGTEYLLSSNAADEATHPVAGTGGDYTSNQLVVWTLRNTASLDSATPALRLSSRLIAVNQYAIPPKLKQPGSGRSGDDAPQGYCINDATTVDDRGRRLLAAARSARARRRDEVVSRPDSNDTRMQQVTYANGKLWGALDTAINPDGGGSGPGSRGTSSTRTRARSSIRAISARPATTSRTRRSASRRADAA